MTAKTYRAECGGFQGPTEPIRPACEVRDGNEEQVRAALAARNSGTSLQYDPIGGVHHTGSMGSSRAALPPLNTEEAT